MMNVEIMTADELVRYGKPTTPLEAALLAKLKETSEELEAYKDVITTSDRGFIESPSELENYLDELEEVESRYLSQENYGDYKEFFDEIVADYEKSHGYWVNPVPWDESLKEAIKTEFTLAKFYTPESARK